MKLIILISLSMVKESFNKLYIGEIEKDVINGVLWIVMTIIVVLC